MCIRDCKDNDNDHTLQFVLLLVDFFWIEYNVLYSFYCPLNEWWKIERKEKKNKSILPTWSDDFYFYFLSLNVPISFFCSHSFANVKITAIIHKIELNLHGSLRPITAFNTISISFLTNALHIQFVHLSLKCFGFFFSILCNFNLL